MSIEERFRSLADLAEVFGHADLAQRILQLGDDVRRGFWNPALRSPLSTIFDRMFHQLGSALRPLAISQRLLARSLQSSSPKDSLDLALVEAISTIGRVLQDVRFRSHFLDSNDNLLPAKSEGKLSVKEVETSEPYFAPFGQLSVSNWIRRQVDRESINDPVARTGLEWLCLAIVESAGRLDGKLRFAERPQLLWSEVTKKLHPIEFGVLTGERNRDPFESTQEGIYHPLLRKLIAEAGIDVEARANPVSPEELAFLSAGGTLPKTEDARPWLLTHLYQGRHPFERRADSLCAFIEGDHFTQAAGMVAIHPDIDQHQHFTPVIHALRWVAFDRFGYDPDHYFNESRAQHDRFGFVIQKGHSKGL